MFFSTLNDSINPMMSQATNTSEADEDEMLCLVKSEINVSEK